MKLSGVPEKAYNSRPSEFGGFGFVRASAPSLHRRVYRVCITTRDVNGYVIVCASARARARVYIQLSIYNTCHVLMKME